MRVPLLALCTIASLWLGLAPADPLAAQVVAAPQRSRTPIFVVINKTSWTQDESQGLAAVLRASLALVDGREMVKAGGFLTIGGMSVSEAPHRKKGRVR